MSRKKQAKEQPEEVPEGSPVAGACVLVILTVVLLAAVYVVSEAVGVLVTSAGATVGLWHAARSMWGALNPAPPPPPEVVEDTKPQFTIVEDREGHCTVQWQKRADST
jgi:hypothetical protein